MSAIYDCGDIYKRGVITAKVQLDTQTATDVARKEVTVQDGDNLEMTTDAISDGENRLQPVVPQAPRDFPAAFRSNL